MKTVGKIFGTLLGLIIIALLIAMAVAPTVFVVFLVLKLCGAVVFSWFWVVFPLILEVGFWSLWLILVTFFGE